MAGFLDLLAQHVGDAEVGQLSQTIGATEAQTRRAVGAALPALLAALNQNTNSNTGAAALAGALRQDHDGTLLDNLGGFLSGAVTGRQADGGGILGHILGGRQAAVEQGVAQASGLNLQQVARLLPLLAPIVMAALGRRQRQANLDDAGLSGMLGKEATRAREAAPDGLLGALTGVLDADRDGDFKDDLMGHVGRAALGRLFGR